jgi:Protein of unknown function (DUF5663)
MAEDKKIGAGLESFVDLLVQEKGLDDVDDEVLAQIKSDLLARVEDRVNATIIAALPLDKIAEAQKIIEKGDEKGTQDYFAHNISNLDEIIAGELIDFRRTYLA